MLTAVAAIAALACSRGPGTRVAKFPSQTTDVVFDASDGRKVYAKLVKSQGIATRAVILMFHQAGSGASEYAPIAPRVAKLGFDCLAVDLRSGGDMYPPPNRTAAQYKDSPDYFAAYRDMEGALKYAKAERKPIVVWGSSYSASLALRLASEHPEVAAVLAFSPGEYFHGSGIVKGWNARVKCPVLMACTDREADEQVSSIFAAASSSGRSYVLVQSKDGIHGSSTLRPDVNQTGNAVYWKAVEAFLDNIDNSRLRDDRIGH